MQWESDVCMRPFWGVGVGRKGTPPSVIVPDEKPKLSPKLETLRPKSYTLDSKL